MVQIQLSTAPIGNRIDYRFWRNWSYISVPFPFKSSYVFPRPFETPKNGPIPFLRNTYKIRHSKKDNGNPTINYFTYEFHSNRNTCPTETEFVTCYPLSSQAKIYLRVNVKDDSFGSTWESNNIALPESMLYIWKGLTSALLSWHTPLPAEPPLPSAPSPETKCRTGANSLSRKKGLTEPGSLTNTKY